MENWFNETFHKNVILVEVKPKYISIKQMFLLVRNLTFQPSLVLSPVSINLFTQSAKSSVEQDLPWNSQLPLHLSYSHKITKNDKSETQMWVQAIWKFFLSLKINKRIKSSWFYSETKQKKNICILKFATGKGMKVVLEVFFPNFYDVGYF